MTWRAWVAVCAMAVIAAGCGPDENNGEANNGEANNGSTNNGSTNNSATNNGSTNNTSTNNTSANNTATNNTATNNTSANNTSTNNTSANNTSTNNANNMMTAALGIVRTDPTDGAQGVALGAPIQVVFDQPVDTATVTDASFTTSPALEGEISWEQADTKLVFTPADALAPETTYEVTLTDAITSPDGQALESGVTFSFTTMAEPGEDTSTYMADGETVQVTIAGDDAARTYTMTTTAALRDNDPPSKMIMFAEQAGQPLVRTGHDVFDALFAMAIEETRQCSVSRISDGAFNNGQGVDCECFETGAKWNYVWTRDTAYAVDLGLAFIDPSRARRSMEFKLSELKEGGGVQIVQDTGSGGSWPVSTDRVVWSIGARYLLNFLAGAERDQFRDLTYDALVNTIAQDREMVYDPTDGLYLGEQSFLDWREQSYPSWTADDTVHLAMSKALSTNVGHYAILSLAAELAEEKGLSQDASQYRSWANDLASSIRERLWLADAGMFSALITTGLDPSPTHKFDLLGESLAVLNGVANENQAKEAVANYPHVPKGPAVLWPQQALTPIYHNRGIWPFVTAYGLLAAREVGNATVFDHDLASLIRGAALNLSNMENFEFTTQKPWVEDGPYSGPVVNSRRQLWSVAGYIGAVVRGVFGMEVDGEGVRFAPFVTPRVHREWFAGQSSIELRDITWRGKKFDVTVNLPAAAASSGGAYEVTAVRLNGAAAPSGFWTADALADENSVEVDLGSPAMDAGAIELVTDLQDFQKLWSPRDPNLNGLSLDNGKIKLDFDAAGEQGVVFHIWRDGVEVATDVTGTSWTDPNSGDWEAVTHCYVVEAKFTSSGNRSQHSKPQCFWGEGGERVRAFTAYAFANQGGEWSSQHGRAHYQNWGRPEHALEIASFRPRWTGDYLLQFEYGNGSGGFNTGITAAVKEIIVEEVDTGAEAGRGVAVMPQLADWARWGESSFVRATLDAGKLYRVRVVDGINMSYFAHFIPYTGGTGGGQDSFNMTNIHALKLLPRGGQLARPQAGGLVALAGDGDIGRYDAGQVIDPGAKLQPWDRWALTWDEDFLYVTLNSEAFEDPYKPMMLYLEAGQGALGAASGSQGSEYSNLTPELPFTANYMISARRLSDDGSASGPWNGIWRRGAMGWERVHRFSPGREWWISADNHTLSLRIPLAALGAPDRLRVAGHVVNAAPANEWKDLLPASHTPWVAGSGGYYEIDLNGAKPATNWTEN